MIEIKQSTETTIEFEMLDDLNDAVTGITPAVQLRKAGGSFAAATNAASEVGLGLYEIVVTSAEANTLGSLIFQVSGTGAKTRLFQIPVVAATVADVDLAIEGLNDLDNVAAESAATAGAAAALATYDGPTKAELDAAVATLATAAALTTVDTVVDAIKAKTDLITAGSVTVVSPVSISGNVITARIADSWEIDLEGLGDLTSRDDLLFQITTYGTTADSAALLTLSEDDGLTRIAGETYETAADGDLTVTDENAGDITITLADEATAGLTKTRDAEWAVKLLRADGTSETLATGPIDLIAARIHATAT